MEMNSSSSSLSDHLFFLISYLFLNWVLKLQDCSSNFLYFIRSMFFITPSPTTTKFIAAGENYYDDESSETISREEVELVLQKLRLLSSLNSHEHERQAEEIKRVMRLKELEYMFEEEEPTDDEVYEAFAVFDSNGDGFIDADELHAVVSNLGRGAATYSSEDCQRMIAVHDENGDGKIDFDEFVKFFQSSLCCS